MRISRWVNGDFSGELFIRLKDRCIEYIFTCDRNSNYVQSEMRQFIKDFKSLSAHYDTLGTFLINAVEAAYLLIFGHPQDAFKQCQEVLTNYSRYAQHQDFATVSYYMTALLLEGKYEIDDEYPEKNIATQPLAEITTQEDSQTLAKKTNMNNAILCKRATQAYSYMAPYPENEAYKTLLVEICWMLAGYSEADESSLSPSLLPESFNKFKTYHILKNTPNASDVASLLSSFITPDAALKQETSDPSKWEDPSFSPTHSTSTSSNSSTSSSTSMGKSSSRCSNLSDSETNSEDISDSSKSTPVISVRSTPG